MLNYYSSSDPVRTLTSKPSRRYGFENREQDLQNELQSKPSVSMFLLNFLFDFPKMNNFLRFCVQFSSWRFAKFSVNSVQEAPFMVLIILLNTSIIGLNSKYYFKIKLSSQLAEKKNSYLNGRAWWIVAITVSAVACFFSIYDVWSNWRDEPIIVAPETRSSSIFRIPFPSVTICPFAAFAAKKFNFTAAYRSLHQLDGNNTRALTDVEYAKISWTWLIWSKNEKNSISRFKMMKLANQFCYEGSTSGIFSGVSNEYLDDDADDLLNTINEFAPAFNETFVFCKLFGKRIDCDKLFVRRTTERGLCYTFNTLNAHELFTNE